MGIVVTSGLPCILLLFQVSRLSEWNPRKAGAANGIMGFFMGISGFLGSFLCTVVINPYNKQLVQLLSLTFLKL